MILLTRKITQLGFAVFFFLISSGISYGVVNFIGVGTKSQSGIILQQEDARNLQKSVNKLARMSNDYFYKMPLDLRTPMPEVHNWIDRNYRPALRELRHEINFSQLPTQAALVQLERAMDNALIMASQPGNTALRRRAARELESAIRAVHLLLEQQNSFRAHIEAPVYLRLPESYRI